MTAFAALYIRPFAYGRMPRLGRMPSVLCVEGISYTSAARTDRSSAVSKGSNSTRIYTLSYTLLPVLHKSAGKSECCSSHYGTQNCVPTRSVGSTPTTGTNCTSA